jgi:hypothetical protein
MTSGARSEEGCRARAGRTGDCVCVYVGGWVKVGLRGWCGVTLSLSLCAEINSESTVSISHLLSTTTSSNDSTPGFSLLVQVADTPPPGKAGFITSLWQSATPVPTHV